MLTIKHLAFLLITTVGCAGPGIQTQAAPSAQPVSCRHALGAWCILALAGRDVSSEYSHKNQTYSWRITDANWDGEEILIREPESCRAVKPDQVEMINHGAVSDGGSGEYQDITFSLRTDGLCDLKVRIQNDPEHSFGWAYASAIIAPCFEGIVCSENNLFNYIAKEYNDARRQSN